MKITKDSIIPIALLVVYILFAITKSNILYVIFCGLLIVAGGINLYRSHIQYQNTNEKPNILINIVVVLIVLYGIIGIRSTLGI